MGGSVKAWIEIKAVNLRHNLTAIQRLTGPKVAVMAVVKANAYGHGLIQVTSVLKNMPRLWFGVDSLEEAFILKRLGVREPIMILGYIPPERLTQAIRAGFHLSVYSPEAARVVSRLFRYNKKLQLHLHFKLETGTYRLGLPLQELLKASRELPIEGLYTHFAEVENPSSLYYRVQLRRFEEAQKALARLNIHPRYIHTASTAALLQYPETRGNLVRLGIGLYGLWPSVEVRRAAGRTIELHPVLTWKTRIAQVKCLRRGETIGYDRTYRARQDREIAILPVGYYDGYDRGLSNRGVVLVNGDKAAVIGRVCMNMTMIDVTGLKARVGQTVVLLGRSGSQEILSEAMARACHTINYEIVSRLNPLLSRFVI